MSKKANWSVYIVECSDGSLYTGITTNIFKRLRQHNGEIKGGAKYTRSRRPVKLRFATDHWYFRGPAQSLESRIKKLSKERKEQLCREWDKAKPGSLVVNRIFPFNGPSRTVESISASFYLDFNLVVICTLVNINDSTLHAIYSSHTIECIAPSPLTAKELAKI